MYTSDPNETVVSGPTVESADRAVAAARAAGHSVQPVIALDNATPETTAYFERPVYDAWERWPLSEGDPGRVRNTLVHVIGQIAYKKD